jgi:tetratricopeptide (TPR) repeat protein
MSLAELRASDILKICTKSSELIYAGQYEASKEVLGDLWYGVGERPNLRSYPPQIVGEVLLQCGCLSGFLGNARAKDVHDKAKDLLTESLRIFQSLKNRAKASEAQYELGICYFRSGAFDEARIVLDEALIGVPTEQQGKIIIGQTIVEIYTGRYEEAQNILNAARPLFDKASHALKGRWHGHMGLVLRRLGQGRTEILDKAIIEFTAAIYHYEQAGHERYCGNNLNNLAMLLYRVGRFQEAYEHLDRAHSIFARLKDAGSIAQVEETRARALLVEERHEEARRVIIGVVDTLERGGEQAFLGDALIIKATAQAKLGDYDYSLHTFRRAMNIAENAGSLCHAGRAAISMIEEHGTNRLSERAIYHLYRRADKLVTTSQDADDIARLRACARIVVRKLFGPQLDEQDFYLPDAVRAYEARFIEQALIEEQGSITHAAHKLGLSHQSLGNILKSRHKKLRGKRKPEVSRK